MTRVTLETERQRLRPMTMPGARTLVRREDVVSMKVVMIGVCVAVMVAGCTSPTPGSTAPSTSPTATPSVSDSPATSPSVSPSASATPEPTDGAIVGAPVGSPVTPEIFIATVDTAANQLIVVVNVPGIFEDGGTCTVTVKSGSATVSLNRIGEADASATACGQFTFSLNQLPGTTASIVATYDSDKHDGSSPATTVDLP